MIHSDSINAESRCYINGRPYPELVLSKRRKDDERAKRSFCHMTIATAIVIVSLLLVL